MNTTETQQSVGTDQSRPGAEVIHSTGVVEGVSNPIDFENQATTLTDCSPPIVPDSVQASVSSTLSVCIPSSLSASMPTNVSTRLSIPVQHSFLCSLCDRSFSQRGSLNRHVRSHLGVRPFSCPHCPMTFSRQYRVTEHMRVHQRCKKRYMHKLFKASIIN
uniref:C2H2-type domain-containing protein n=1 Tax=Cyclopterus lumpus TaxID=8103 RepID=A0A8C2WKM3_CYCLU